MEEFSFKNITITEDEIIWFNELLSQNFKKIDIKILRVKLRDQISKSFDPLKIDLRLVRYNRLTLVGLWLVDPHNNLIKYSSNVIDQIKSFVIDNPKIDKIDASIIASSLDLQLWDTEIILTLLWDIEIISGGIFEDNEILFRSGSFGNDPNGFNKILSFENLDKSIEEFFLKHEPKKNISYEPINTYENNTYFNNNIWNGITQDFGIAKSDLDARIYFIQSELAKEIIYRDIEHSYLLVKNNFPKPAIILVGWIIEELLRLYLESNNIKSSENNFYGYIKTCEEQNILRKVISKLSDVFRQFRNSVHLKEEFDSGKIISKSTAWGCVSLMFTVIMDFDLSKND